MYYGFTLTKRETAMRTEEEIAKAANDAYESYDFGDGIEVTDAGTWEYTTPGLERSRRVYVESEREDDGPRPRWTLNFTVRFNEAGNVEESYALDDKGQFWGHA